MQSVQFASPQLATSAMSRQDQIDCQVNQAVAIIVSAYLGHMNAAIQKDLLSPGSVTTAGNTNNFITRTELVDLVNEVQAALRNVS